MNRSCSALPGSSSSSASPSLLSTNRQAIRLARRRRRLRAAGGDRLSRALDQLGTRRHPEPVDRRRQPARLCQQGHRIPVRARATSNPLANTFAIAALPVIIFFASLVAILYYLGIMQRIVRWVGGAIGWVTGHQPRRIPDRRRQHLRRPVGIAAGRPALSRRASALAAVHGDVRRHGRRRRHDPRRLREPARRAAICPTCSPPRSCPRPAAS